MTGTAEVKRMPHPKLAPFVKSVHSVLGMPIKERIKHFQNVYHDATGKQATWAQAKQICEDQCQMISAELRQIGRAHV